MNVRIYETGEIKTLSRKFPWDESKDVVEHRLDKYGAFKTKTFVKGPDGMFTCRQRTYDEWHNFFEAGKLLDARLYKIALRFGMQNAMSLTNLKLKPPKCKEDELAKISSSIDCVYRHDNEATLPMVKLMVKYPISQQFQHWSWACDPDRNKTFAHIYARFHTLPKTFPHWALEFPGGLNTVAHEAAAYGTLPPDFDQWEIIDFGGWSVAHIAASYQHLPPDFDKWEIRTRQGESVAHFAAMQGPLPPHFDKWDLKDEWGVTVLEFAAMYGTCTPEQLRMFRESNVFKTPDRLASMKEVHQAFIRAGSVLHD